MANVKLGTELGIPNFETRLHNSAAVLGVLVKQVTG